MVVSYHYYYLRFRGAGCRRHQTFRIHIRKGLQHGNLAVGIEGQETKGFLVNFPGLVEASRLHHETIAQYTNTFAFRSCIALSGHVGGHDFLKLFPGNQSILLVTNGKRYFRAVFGRG